MKKYILIFISLLVLIIVVITIINFHVLKFSQKNYFYNINGLDKHYVGLVFGASVLSNKIPSEILKDRLKVAYDAYKNGKIEKIIVSGDNSKTNYNEPFVMKKYLETLGVDDDDIYLDYAGFDTYDSIYRAKEIFGVKELVLFTQDFHLKRAMYISKKLGIKTFGVETNLQKYLLEDYNNRREILARIKAFLEIEIFKSKPKYLGEKIEIITDEKIQNTKNKLIKRK